MSRNCVCFLGRLAVPKVHSRAFNTRCRITNQRGRIPSLSAPKSRNSVQWIQQQVRGFSCSRSLCIDYTPRQMVVTTNFNYWDERPEGIQMHVTYIDTAADLPDWEAQRMPTVLATHGSPGNHKDILDVLKPLAESGARVILPNFPGYDLTYGVTQEDEDFFTHTTEERAQFLMQVLNTLNISRVDMMLCHSAASWPLIFMAQMLPTLKGIAMLCPGPGHTPPRSSRPEWFMVLLSRMWDRHWLRPLVNLTVRVLVKPISGIGYGKVSHIIHAMRTAAGFQFPLFPSLMGQLKMRELSMLQVMCKNDVLMEYPLSKKSAQMLGFPDEAVDHYDSNGARISQGKVLDNRYVKRVVFDLKTHYPQRKPAFLPIIHREVLALYNFIVKTAKTEEKAEESNGAESSAENGENGQNGLNGQMAKTWVRNV